MGLLDQMFGAGGDDPRSQAMGLLAAGLMKGNAAGGLLGANQVFAEAPHKRMRDQLLQAQIAETQAQAQERVQRAASARESQARQERFLYGEPGEQVSAGAFSPSADGMGPTMPASAAPQRGGVMALVKQLGLPPEAIQADIAFNGGKKISELLASRSAPKWENVNGNLVNTNAPGFQGGFQPGMNTSANGQVTAWQPDGRGGVTVGAPNGALATYDAYQRSGERAKADYDPFTIPAGPGRPNPTLTTRGAVVGGQQAPMPQGPQGPVRASPAEAGLRPQIAAPMGADPEAIKRELRQITNDLNTRQLDPGSRQALTAHAQDLTAQLSKVSQGQGQPGGIAIQSEPEAAARKAYQEGVAKDVVDQRKAIMNSGFSAPKMIAKYQQLGGLLAGVDGGMLTPLGTDIASMANSLGFKLDKNLSNKEAAASLANEMALEMRNPANGAGMPGAMSDADRKFLTSITPNSSQSAAGRKMVVEAGIATARRNQQVAEFARKYETKYGQLDNGFFSQLQSWSNQNNLFGGK